MTSNLDKRDLSKQSSTVTDLTATVPLHIPRGKDGPSVKCAASSTGSFDASDESAAEGSSCPTSPEEVNRGLHRLDSKNGRNHAEMPLHPQRGPGRPRLTEEEKAQRTAQKEADKAARKVAKSIRSAAAKAERTVRNRKASTREQTRRYRHHLCSNDGDSSPIPKATNHPKATRRRSRANLIHPSQCIFRPGSAPSGTFQITTTVRAAPHPGIHIPGVSGTATYTYPWWHLASVYCGRHPEFDKHGDSFWHKTPGRDYYPRTPSVCTERTVPADWGPGNATNKGPEGHRETTHHSIDADPHFGDDPPLLSSSKADQYVPMATDPIDPMTFDHVMGTPRQHSNSALGWLDPDVDMDEIDPAMIHFLDPILRSW